MKLFETFEEPLEFRDYHLAVFFVQLVVIIASVLLCFKFFYLDNGKNNLESLGGFWASVCYDIKAREGEGKFLRKIPSLNSDHEMKLTDQFIDLKNGGIWITERQDIMFTGGLLGVYLANVVLMFAGAGPIYHGIRSVIGIVTREMCPFFIFIIPFGLWGALLCIALFIVGVITMFLAPFNLVLHLILGIIQTTDLIKKIS